MVEEEAQAPHRINHSRGRRKHHPPPPSAHAHCVSWLEQTQRPLQLVAPSGLEAVVSPTDAAAGQSPMGTPLPLLLSRTY